MPELRRGPAAIEDAAKRKGGGSFQPFAPEIRWREDGEKKYVLILTPIDEVATVDLHEWIPVGTAEKANGETYTKFEQFLSRKDPFVGEDHDRIEDDLDRPSKRRCYGVGIELEPVMENVNGRMRPTSFSAKTETFTRNTDDGEVEVEAPLLGLIIQSSALMWSPLASYDESQGPLIGLPLEVVRQGTDANTRYNFVPFMDMPVDLSSLLNNVDGIGYLSDDQEDIEAAIAASDDDFGAAQAIAETLFTKRLVELADGDRYQELVDPITEIPDKFGKGKKKGSSSRASRPARPSQRDKAETSAEESPAEEEAPKTTTAQKFAELKARVEKDPQ